MSEAKFSKGPWTPCMYNNDDIQVTFFGVVIGGCYHNLGSGIEYQANAHLIAASPDMYKEIEQDISWLEQMKSKFVLGSYEYRSICLRIKSKQKLLAKARGEA